MIDLPVVGNLYNGASQMLNNPHAAYLQVLCSSL